MHMAKMTLVNVCVYCKTRKRVILPWQITSIQPPSLTFRDHFSNELFSKRGYNSSLSEVFVGKMKDTMDQVDSSLAITEVTQLFGHFTKYFVEQNMTDPVQV